MACSTSDLGQKRRCAMDGRASTSLYALATNSRGQCNMLAMAIADVLGSTKNRNITRELVSDR